MIANRPAIVAMLMRVQCGDCPYCGVDLMDGYHVDHIYPRVKGGTDDVANLQLLCPTCNMAKGGKTESEYFAQFSEPLGWNHIVSKIIRMAYWHTEFGQDNEHELRFVE